MFVRAVATKTMPLGNLTGMTDEEREFLGAWFAAGRGRARRGRLAARRGRRAGARRGGPRWPRRDADGGVADDPARTYFATVCSSCHGASGAGDGLAAAALNPKPRNFTDAAWQASVTDEHLKKIILEGGPSVGKSVLMPPNPGLAEEPATIDGLVKMIRGFGKKP